jgi:uncharacterized protein
VHGTRRARYFAADPALVQTARDLTPITQQMVTVVKCPTCGKDVRWTPENRFRPFCSERCKQMDLGAWANEKYRIGSTDEEPPSDDDEHGDLN